VPAAEIERTARLLWEHRPVAFYTWSGLEQHSGTTQIIRAINVLYALTGCLDAPGGNVLFTPVPSNPVAGAELLDRTQRAKAIGIEDRPLGPARFGFVNGEDFYTAALEGRPYRARGLVNFGSNLVMAQGDSARGREALQALDFFVHLDHFMSPTAEQADIVLPVAAAFEAEGLKIGFEVSQEAQSLVQLRRPLVRAGRRGPVGPGGHLRSRHPPGARRALLRRRHRRRLGTPAGAERGDPPAVARRPRRRLPASGDRAPQVRGGGRRRRAHRLRHPDGTDRAVRRGLPRPRLAGAPHLHRTGVEPPFPSRPRRRVPLVLTCAKSLYFCETQHRQVAGLRRHAPDPEVEVHPDTATARGITEGQWVEITTPRGSVRARAVFDPTLDPAVVCGQHGWHAPCEELDLPGYPAFGPGSANLNLVLGQTPSDPISGSSPLRAQVCDIAPLTGDAADGR
jgi:anaerobic selenocysteine-containing dehydrogenase